MSSKNHGVRLARAGVVATAAATAAMCGAAGVAVGQTGTRSGTTSAGATANDGTTPAGATTTGADETTTANGPKPAGASTTADQGTASSDTTSTASGGTTTTSGGTGGGGGSGGGRRGSLRLMAESAGPSKAFIYGDRRVRYEFTLDGDRSKNLKIQAVRRDDWKVVRVWRRDDLEPGSYQVRWNGVTRDDKTAAKGAYLFRVRTMQGADLDRSRAKGDDRSVKLYPAKFPVRARHTYGDGFGAPRAGHVHQGQDLLAKCGKRVVAARGGRVQYSGYQAGGAGNYVVIDGKADSHDYVYMHLKKRGPHKGSRVHTGETIGRVGQTGDASGCHLHFEMWSRPGWYEGGHAMRTVTKHLKKWDHWS
ncbi:MAG TPA: peptidoglycan DD-metalloendopeptidase family protein [Solirubrobacterales bacterium]|nr:peptidoglycan DD-metalloendopeptidase family protein [Solirubrobacterales bacterium]